MIDRIATITPYLIPGETNPGAWWARKPYIFVRVETTGGVVGWGECHHLNHRERALIGMIRDVGDWLAGRPAGDIRALAGEVFGSFGHQRPGLEAYAAFAGIEIALWDILGLRHGAPVCDLLGGACHDSVPVYANIYSPDPQTPDAFAAMATKQAKAGHTAIKLYPFRADTSVDDGLAILQAVRDAVGPGIGLAVDLWRHATPARATRLARAMEPFDLLWIEDPLPPDDAATLRYIRDSIQQPLLSGETLPTRREFGPLLDARAVDIVNPDICQTGILEIQAIAIAAEMAGITLSPHNSNSMALGTAAAMHASVGLTNLGLLEYFPLFDTALDDLCEGRLPVRDGAIERPTAAGLGLTWDEAAMQRFRL